MLVRKDFDRAEVVTGILWLCIGALLSLFLEAIYLSARIPLPGGASVIFPVTILIAFWFNSVLTRTAKLWSDSAYIVALPLVAWIAGYGVFLLLAATSGDQVLASSVRSLLLLFAGIVGGVWPFFRQK